MHGFSHEYHHESHYEHGDGEEYEQETVENRRQELPLEGVPEEKIKELENWRQCKRFYVCLYVFMYVQLFSSVSWKFLKFEKKIWRKKISHPFSVPI